MQKIIFYILILLLGPFIAYSDGPALKSDFSIRSQTLVPAYIPTTDRECGSTLMIFHQCGFKYEQEGVEQSVNYKMFAFGAPKTVILLKSLESGTLTSTVGQEYFWNRVFTIIFCLFLSGFFGLAMVSAFRNMGRDSGQHVSTPQVRPAQSTRRTAVINGQSGGFGQRSDFQG